MSRMIYCVKMKQNSEGLTAPPYPGELGKKIYLNICKEAWQEWIKKQTMLINEYRLNAADLSAQELLEKEMVTFLFEEEDHKE